MNNNKADEIREKINSMMPEDIKLLFSHKRLSEPLDEIIRESMEHSSLVDEIFNYIASEAARNAMSASGAIASLPEGQTKRAMDIMVHAWSALQELCIFGIHEE